MSDNVSRIPEEGCSGCTACESICPTDAIIMQPDTQGFLYPSVDEDKCVSCKLCVKVCPYSQESNLKAISYHAVKNTDKEEQLLSSSGGFASALTEQVIGNGGVAYGVVETGDFEILTVRAATGDQAKGFYGSKYVQTNPCKTFREAQTDLKEGKSVVFFASSCHIDGLLRFLHQTKTPVDNLLTVDFVCHGVPSPAVFQSYARYGQEHKKMVRYLFRTKEKGWGNGSRSYAPCIVVKKKDKIKTEFDTPFARAWLDLFFSNNCLRPHCYQCPYAGKGRAADITMADFWGLAMSHPEFFDPNGVSLVIANTEKGVSGLHALDNLEIIPTDYEAASRKQGNMFGPSKKAKTYDEFWSDFKSKRFSYVMKKYTHYNTKDIIKRAIKKLLRR